MKDPYDIKDPEQILNTYSILEPVNGTNILVSDMRTYKIIDNVKNKYDFFGPDQLNYFLDELNKKSTEKSTENKPINHIIMMMSTPFIYLTKNAMNLLTKIYGNGIFVDYFENYPNVVDNFNEFLNKLNAIKRTNKNLYLICGDIHFSSDIKCGIIKQLSTSPITSKYDSIVGITFIDKIIYRIIMPLFNDRKFIQLNDFIQKQNYLKINLNNNDIKYEFITN
jgi:hypothetical protein